MHRHLIGTVAALLAIAALAATAQAHPVGARGNNRAVIVRGGGVGTYRSFGSSYGGGYGYAPTYSYGYAYQPTIVQAPLATYAAPAAVVQAYAEPAYAAPVVVAAPAITYAVQQPVYVVPAYGFGTYGSTYGGTYGYGRSTFGNTGRIIRRR